MKSVGSFYRSSIGRKVLMALTGLVLIGFVIGHLVGNLQVFSSPDKINGYAEFLHHTGPALWVARIFLILCTVIHVWAAISLTRENQRARGGPRYAVKHTIRATLASRTMRLTGFVVLAFVVYHLLHFTIGGVDANFKANLPLYTLGAEYHILGVGVVPAGTAVLDVHTMMVKGFQNPIVSVFYIVAVGLLSYHILHGLESMFQTLGLRNGSWSRALRRISLVFAALYFLGNAAIPASILSGVVTTHPAPAAAPSVASSLTPASR